MARDRHPTGALVIGYGNDLRADDAAGRRVAELVAALSLPGVTVRSMHQLTPELAEELSEARIAVFVDARIPAEDADEETCFEAVAVGSTASDGVGGHLADPASLLALSQALYGRTPDAWRVTIPAERLDFGETLSPSVEQAAFLAAERIWWFLRQEMSDA
ncbi:hydrogenase maturation protease [Candidatus Poribacteria bacterium]|nr:hydrogenase maturation protease [Candidatus Poribacteria bacterium]